jgi:hypothetical protein
MDDHLRVLSVGRILKASPDVFFRQVREVISVYRLTDGVALNIDLADRARMPLDRA